MKHRLWSRLSRARLPILLLLAVMLGATPAAAAASAGAGNSSNFPALIQLPTGFGPEGLAAGLGTSFYTGSLSGHQGIYRGDFRTGQGGQLVNDPTRAFAGMKVDTRSNYLFVAGASSGYAYVYDAGTGAPIATMQLSQASPRFINDLAFTQGAAYFTDSYAPRLYKVAIGPNGQLIQPVVPQAITLSGDWQQVATPGAFNANGIAATPDGRYLIVVNTSVGRLYRVDPATGLARAINLGGASVSRGDGILLAGQTLYVVRNTLNQIDVITLSPDFTSGTVTAALTNSSFHVPTAVAILGNTLYAVNAKFGTPPAGTPYEVVKVNGGQ